METMGARGEALALLTPGGRILSMTAAFERLLGDRLTAGGGHVRTEDPAEDGLLQALIARAASWDGSPDLPLPPVILRRAISAPLVVRALPVAGSARDFLGLARIILAVDDLAAARPAGAEAILHAAFGLTPAEARLAARIGSGESLRDAADAEGVTLDTARTRLKVIFGKTGTGRQAELALLVSRTAG